MRLPPDIFFLRRVVAAVIDNESMTKGRPGQAPRATSELPAFARLTMVTVLKAEPGRLERREGTWSVEFS